MEKAYKADHTGLVSDTASCMQLLAGDRMASGLWVPNCATLESTSSLILMDSALFLSDAMMARFLKYSFLRRAVFDEEKNEKCLGQCDMRG